MKILVTLLLSIAVTINASPFEITDRYVQSYHDGIAALIKEAHDFHPHERNFAEEFKDAEAKPDAHEYDFIIVGGGTSGAVLASRLTEIPEYKVLLLEAGGEETKITRIPAMAKKLKYSHLTWGYKTEPQKTWCLGNEHHQCHVPTGKICGGTSSINDMIYTRGNSRDYDLWADDGNDRWCFSDVLPYFKKSENAHLHNFDRKYHNQGGLLSVEDPRHHSNLTHLFIDAGKELKQNIVDYNGKDQIGYSPVQIHTKEGERQSTFQAYINHFKNRHNLYVRPKSQVVEIIISPHTKEATGVKYVHGDHFIVAKASKEVIIAAGAINTPQILMLSGIGPKDQLEAQKIDCVQDAPVGKNLKDHPVFTGLSYFYNQTNLDHHDDEYNMIHYLRYGKGPLSTPLPEALAFSKTEASKDTSHYPDIYMTFIPHEASFDLHIAATHPKSKGHVGLKSKDPLNFPKIDLNYFSDEDDHDISTILAGIRLGQKICETEAFKGAAINEHAVEGCVDHKFNTDDYWKCAIKHMTISAGHYTGTCRMGKDIEKNVVDANLRVHGIHKLRIADASVIPISITGHTQAATVMIAEKAADLIKHDWK